MEHQPNQPPAPEKPQTRRREAPETPEYREKRERSYEEVRKLIERLEKLGEPHAEDYRHYKAEKFEPKNEEEVKQLGKELNQFFGQFFLPEENMDPMQQEIFCRQFGNNYIMRDESGAIVSVLQTEMLEFPNPAREPAGLGFYVPYVATSEDHRGKNLSIPLYIQAFRDSLAEAEQNGRVFESTIVEAEPAVEKMSNERFDRKRVYYEREDGTIVEIPFEAPPEDESNEGAPEHLMVSFLGGSQRVPVERIILMVEQLHEMYYRKEYFTPEYLQFAQQWYNQFENPEDQEKERVISHRSAAAHRRAYMLKVMRVTELFKKHMEGVKEVFLLSRDEREKMKQEGKTFIDWESAEEAEKKE